MSFRLPSLNLATAYDARPAPLRLPGEIRRVLYPELALADGIGVASDGTIRLASRALLGIRVETDAMWVKVSLRLAVDNRTRTYRAEAGLVGEVSRLHAVALCGTTGGAALSLGLFAPQAPGELIEIIEAVLPVRDGLVTFVLRPDDHAHDMLLPDSLAGVRIDSVRVEVWAEDRSAELRMTTGRPQGHKAPLPTWSSLLALTPLHLPGGLAVRGRLRLVGEGPEDRMDEIAEQIGYRVVASDGAVLVERGAIARSGATVLPIGRVDRPVYVRVLLPLSRADIRWRVRFIEG